MALATEESAAARQLAAPLISEAALAGIGNLRFKVSPTLAEPREEKAKIVDQKR